MMEHKVFLYLMETVAMQVPLGKMVTFWNVNFIFKAQGLIDYIHLPASTPENFEPREGGSMSE
jgi:hypothetical protein